MNHSRAYGRSDLRRAVGAAVVGDDDLAADVEILEGFLAFFIQISRVSASLRHGIRIDNSVRLPSILTSEGVVCTSVTMALDRTAEFTGLA